MNGRPTMASYVEEVPVPKTLKCSPVLPRDSAYANDIQGKVITFIPLMIVGTEKLF